MEISYVNQKEFTFREGAMHTVQVEVKMSEIHQIHKRR
jgi:hypothetical protein